MNYSIFTLTYGNVVYRKIFKYVTQDKNSQEYRFQSSQLLLNRGRRPVTRSLRSVRYGIVYA